MRARRGQEIRAGRRHRAALAVLPGRAHSGVLPRLRDFARVRRGGGLSDRYANYFHKGWEHTAGNQPCLAHSIRDYQDAAECYPRAIWPVQAQRALRGLIRTWHAARDSGQAAIPQHIRDLLLREFRHAVLAGLCDVPRIPRAEIVKRPAPWPGPAGILPRTAGRRDQVLRRHEDLADEQTSPSAACARSNPAEDIRPTHQRTGHPGPPGHPQLHRRRPQTRLQRQDVLRAVMTGTPWLPPEPAPA